MKPSTAGNSATEIITRMAAAARSSDAETGAKKRADLDAELRPLVSEAKGLSTRLGMLQSRHMSRVSAVAHADFAAVRIATPKNLVFENGALISPTHIAIWRLEQAATAVPRAQFQPGRLGHHWQGR